MRFRFIVIIIAVVVLSLFGGLGLRFALAWVSPSQPPPDGNVPPPINEGATNQAKTGGLNIGGLFHVNGLSSGIVIGNPIPTGGDMGEGSLNAKKICINGNCLTSWTMADAFVQGGNTGFGPTAILGTKWEATPVPLSIITNGDERIRIDTAGNVGIGTTNTTHRLMVAGSAPRIYLLPLPNTNPELDFGSPAMDTHWSIYRDMPTDQLRFWRTDNRMALTNTGNVGIGTISPFEKLHVADGSLYLGPDFHDGNYGRTIKIGWEGDPDVHHSIQTTVSQGGAAQNGMRFYVHGGTANDNQILTLALTGSGNVGVGTTTPGELLTLGTIGSGGARKVLQFSNGGWDNPSSPGANSNGDKIIFYTSANDKIGMGFATDNSIWFQSHGGAAGFRFWTGASGAAPTEKVTITNAGNLGIGATSPSHKLVVSGASPRAYLWPSGGGNPELNFGNVAGDNHWSIYRDTASDELRFWRGENNVIMTAAGDLNSRRCFGSVYVGQTSGTHNGERGGYDDANSLCAASFSGSHVCTTQEILETVDCNRASLPTVGQAWISNGPPGFTARANDCRGWTSSVGSGAEVAYGAIWAFDASGGVGWVTTCNMTLKFACCR